MTLTTPLPELFNRRFGPIPPITTTDQDGAWGTANQRQSEAWNGGEAVHYLRPPSRP